MGKEKFLPEKVEWVETVYSGSWGDNDGTLGSYESDDCYFHAYPPWNEFTKRQKLHMKLLFTIPLVFAIGLLVLVILI